MGLVEALGVNLSKHGVVVEGGDTACKLVVALAKCYGGPTQWQLDFRDQISLKSSRAVRIRLTLSHGMQGLWEVINHLLHELWKTSLLSQLLRELPNLFGGWNFPSQQQPEHSLGKHLCA